LLLFHSAEYLKKLEEINITGGSAGISVPFSKGGLEIAKYAVGCGIRACLEVLEGKIKNAYALLRPPGHHAEKDKGMGFCLLNNIAIAAKYLLKEKST
jgi:acetoin utilization deacetylase AcuC-like enzyme